ncbi:MAG TPA: elongation factor P [Bacteroidia bacterium]|nr:elongation factor P [Bacteroidia bacterium]
MADTGDVSIGTFLRYNGELVQVVEWQHRTPGNLRAFYQGKMRNLRNGKLVENRFRSGELVEIVYVEYKNLQFIYPEDTNVVLMDKDTFEQIYLPKEMIGDGIQFLKEGMDVKVWFENDEPISAEPPSTVELEVTYTEPGMKGDTATNTLKPATLETGAKVSVPLFINQGDKVKVDTRTRNYMERVKQ